MLKSLDIFDPGAQVVITKSKDHPEMTIKFNPNLLLNSHPDTTKSGERFNDYKYSESLKFIRNEIDEYIRSFV